MAVQAAPGGVAQPHGGQNPVVGLHDIEGDVFAALRFGAGQRHLAPALAFNLGFNGARGVQIEIDARAERTGYGAIEFARAGY